MLVRQDNADFDVFLLRLTVLLVGFDGAAKVMSDRSPIRRTVDPLSPDPGLVSEAVRFLPMENVRGLVRGFY